VGIPSDSRLRETYTCWQGKSEKSKKLSRRLREEIGLLQCSQGDRQVAMIPLRPSASFGHPKEKVMRPSRWQTVLGIAVLGLLMFPPLPAWGRQPRSCSAFYRVYPPVWRWSSPNGRVWISAADRERASFYSESTEPMENPSGLAVRGRENARREALPLSEMGNPNIPIFGP
jgi:hypothetical protein